jgi:hypothetical protein
VDEGGGAADNAADELYGLPPEGFIAARDERVRAARAAGDRELAARLGELRRPTTSAWVLNLLVRDQPELLEQLLGLGAELREAQRELRGPALRELAGQRQRVVAELVRTARRRAADAGHPVTTETGYEVEQTLHAALADPDVAREVCAGHLVRPVTVTGFGEGTGGGAPARAEPAPRPPRSPAKAAGPVGRRTGTAAPADREQAERERVEREEARRREERDRLVAARDEARADLERAEADLRAAEDGLAGVEQARTDAEAQVEALEEQLNAARRALRDASGQIRPARSQRDTAERIKDGAARRLADATARLDKLRG